MGEIYRVKWLAVVLAALVASLVAGGSAIALLLRGDQPSAPGVSIQVGPQVTAASQSRPAGPPATPPASTPLPSGLIARTRPRQEQTPEALPLSLEQRVGQLFMLGFDGADGSGAVARLISERHIGGVVLLGANILGPQQLKDLTARLQRLAEQAGDSGLLISADQEGGLVQRLPAPPYQPLPSARQMAAQGPAQVRAYAQRTARDLRAGGINMDLAPVLDVNDNPANPVIGNRAFGVDPQTVIDNGIAFLEGLQAEGVAAVAKHFPGHGNTSQDSHLLLPYVSKTDEQLRTTELPPFIEATRAGIDAVMVAHVVYAAWDANRPASLSPAIITGILRAELRYNGVIMTDDMNMRAITDTYGPGEAAVLALEAGVDIILLAGPLSSQQVMIDNVLAAVRGGRISEARLDESVRRVLALKQKLGLTTR